MGFCGGGRKVEERGFWGARSIGLCFGEALLSCLTGLEKLEVEALELSGKLRFARLRFSLASQPVLNNLKNGLVLPLFAMTRRKALRGIALPSKLVGPTNSISNGEEKAKAD